MKILFNFTTYLIKQMKIYHYSIVLSFLSLWLNSYFPSEGLYILGLLLILSFGVFHGANDIAIIYKSYKTLSNSLLYRLIGVYLTIVLFFALFFTFFPSVSLFCFVLLSAYHFGEQHWQHILKDEVNFLKYIFKFSYGSLIFVLIFIFHQEEVENIIAQISGVYLNLYFLQNVLIILGLLIIAIGTYFYFTIQNFKSHLAEQIFYLMVLTIIFKVSDLIWAFAIFFVLWHSIPSLYDQIKFIHGKVNKTNVIKYFKKAFWYWLVSVLGLIIMYLIFKETQVLEALLFSFLAAITFPHVIVINKMFKQSAS